MAVCDTHFLVLSDVWVLCPVMCAYAAQHCNIYFASVYDSPFLEGIVQHSCMTWMLFLDIKKKISMTIRFKVGVCLVLVWCVFCVSWCLMVCGYAGMEPRVVQVWRLLLLCGYDFQFVRVWCPVLCGFGAR